MRFDDMRTVHVKSPSFPVAAANEPITILPQKVWQVLCGDEGHWRAGIFSPKAASAAECPELEIHTCPELFVLMDGRLTLLLLKGTSVEELPLETGKPILVTCAHAGYCPDGAHTGRAFVVERDIFSTEYSDRPPMEGERAR